MSNNVEAHDCGFIQNKNGSITHLSAIKPAYVKRFVKDGVEYVEIDLKQVTSR